jgi:glycosyltransferase involved in cell wall biosynthesis
MLLLDTAYSLDTARLRGIEQALLSEDLDGYFEHVWHVHPLVGADPTSAPGRTHGRAHERSLSERHTVIEGHPALWRRWLPLASFAAAQTSLVLSAHRVLAARPIAVVRVGDPYYLGLLGLMLARAHRVPLAIRVNGNYDEIYAAIGTLAYPRLFRSRAVEKRIDRFVLPRADLVAAPNDNNLQFALDNGARRDRTAVFRYGSLIAPVHFTEPAARSGVRSELGLGDRPYTVTISRLERVKRVDDVVAMLARVKLAHPDIAAVVVGEGAEREELMRLAAELGVADDLVLPGSRDQEWIARACAGAAVFVAPSAGRALVEGALAGVPMVAYDLDWHAELVREGVTGLLVPAGDVAGLAAAVNRVLSDPQGAAALGAAARAAALDEMSPRRLVQVQVSAYDRLLAAADGSV